MGGTRTGRLVRHRFRLPLLGRAGALMAQVLGSRPLDDVAHECELLGDAAVKDPVPEADMRNEPGLAVCLIVPADPLVGSPASTPRLDRRPLAGGELLSRSARRREGDHPLVGCSGRPDPCYANAASDRMRSVLSPVDYEAAHTPAANAA
jgi:hypothetical protein